MNKAFLQKNDIFGEKDFGPEHERLMSQALTMAKRAFERGEVPVGAVVVSSDGQVLARASNRVEAYGCQLGHAEVAAIKRACKKMGNWRLDGCWMFVTLQPCMMCLGLMSLSRMAGVVFGAKSPLFGFSVKKEDSGSAYAGLKVVSGLKERDCAGILTKFFELARKAGRPIKET